MSNQPYSSDSHEECSRVIVRNHVNEPVLDWEQPACLMGKLVVIINDKGERIIVKSGLFCETKSRYCSRNESIETFTEPHITLSTIAILFIIFSLFATAIVFYFRYADDFGLVIVADTANTNPEPVKSITLPTPQVIDSEEIDYEQESQLALFEKHTDDKAISFENGLKKEFIMLKVVYQSVTGEFREALYKLFPGETTEFIETEDAVYFYAVNESRSHEWKGEQYRLDSKPASGIHDTNKIYLMRFDFGDLQRVTNKLVIS